MSQISESVNQTTLNTASSALLLTDAAALKIKQLIEEENNPQLNLRVYIIGGGCSGFQYGFSFEETIQADDIITEKAVPPTAHASTVKLVCDAMSIHYLRGATIDYREDINGSQFVIKNPNAKTTCGCGSSFSVDTEE